jgi:hypothetical protein
MARKGVCLLARRKTNSKRWFNSLSQQGSHLLTAPLITSFFRTRDLQEAQNEGQLVGIATLQAGEVVIPTHENVPRFRPKEWVHLSPNYKFTRRVIADNTFFK